nr:MAG: replication associated protein [Cressdnaviricota sp.]
MSRYRAYAFTINNYTHDDIDRMFMLPSQYLFFAFEEGEEKKTPHIQGYFYLQDAKTRSAVSKIMPRASLRFAKGTVEHNQVYCKKAGDWYEFGDPPEQGKLNREAIEHVMANPYESFHLYNQYHRTYKLLKREELESERGVPHIIVIPYDDRYTFFKQYKSICTDYEQFCGEEALVFYSYPPWRLIEDMQHGISPKIKRGYEVISVVPKAVFLTYESLDDFNTLRNYINKNNIEVDDWYKAL